jgi:hypothetical protein
MPCICYVEKNFSAKSRTLIEQANEIIDEYQSQGYTLTLRQLYYQFVARDLIANKMTEYKRLGSVINDARLAGLIDWEAIEDRTRNLESLSHWDDPAEIIGACSRQFRYDRWADQSYRVEVWIEKEALAGVFERICNKLDVPYLACRGYMSQSEMWRAAVRLSEYDQETIILHFGDHDPSGIDMTRDIQDRLRILDDHGTRVKRVALNMDQVEKYGPPPNPAKITDSRADNYIMRYGDQSWELDALDPKVLEELVETEVDNVMDIELMDKAVDRQDKAREAIRMIADNWDAVVEDYGPQDDDEDDEE